jgi:peptidoglycan/xylan/chitin deacetylase (PgdA/CDA1 family)
MQRPGSVLLLLVVAFASPQAVASSSPRSRQIALTFDDLPGVVLPGEGTVRLAEITEKLVSAIVAERVPAIGFVNEGKLGPEGASDPERVALLERWLAAGLELGNHTFSHIDLHRHRLDAFQQDAACDLRFEYRSFPGTIRMWSRAKSLTAPLIWRDPSLP